MKALVIGSTGQLGANLVRALLQRGYEVKALTRKTSDPSVLRGLPVDTVLGDVHDRPSLSNALKGCDALFHAGAYYPVQTIAVDRAVTLGLQDVRNCLEAAGEAGIRRIVYSSTLTTIGPSTREDGLADEECRFVPQYPRNPYLMAKAAMEDEVRRFAGRGLNVVIVNPTAFYGPYDAHMTSGKQIVMIARGQMPGYIEGLINVIDVRDVAAAMVNALERGRVGERYILGHLNTTQSGLNRMIAKIAGVRAPMIRVPFQMARWGSKVGEWVFASLLRLPAPVPGFFVEVMASLRHYDNQKAIRELELRQSPVEEAIRDSIRWFRENGRLPAKAPRKAS